MIMMMMIYCAIDKLHRRELQLFQLIGHIKKTQATKLCGYPGFDVERILRLVAAEDAHATKTKGGNCSAHHHHHRHPSSSNQSTDDRTNDSMATRPDNWTLAAGADHSSTGATPPPPPLLGDGRGGGDSQLDIEEFRAEMQQEHDVLHEVAHCLHFASIAMLGFLVVEVSHPPRHQRHHLRHHCHHRCRHNHRHHHHHLYHFYHFSPFLLSSF